MQRDACLTLLPFEAELGNERRAVIESGLQARLAAGSGRLCKIRDGDCLGRKRQFIDSQCQRCRQRSVLPVDLAACDPDRIDTQGFRP